MIEPATDKILHVQDVSEGLQVGSLEPGQSWITNKSEKEHISRQMQTNA